MNQQNQGQSPVLSSEAMWTPIRAKDAKRLVFPARPTFDKMVGGFLVATAMGKVFELPPMEFRSEQHPSPLDWDRWEKGQAYVIDVGAQKYQLQEKGSAAEIIISREPELKKNDVLLKLVKMTVDNNQTGFLKGIPQSIVWILREMYQDGHPVREVVEAVMDVVHCWVRVHESEQLNQPLFSEARTIDSLRECSELKDILQRCASKTLVDEFSVGQYVANMWCCGYSTDLIKLRANWFLDANRVAKLRKEGLGKVWDQADKRFFAFDGQSATRAVFIRTIEEGLAGWAIKNITRAGKPIQLVMVRRFRHDPRERNVAILTNATCRPNLSALAEALILVEGHAQENKSGAWYFDTRINALLNGTSGFGAPATFLSDELLINLVEVLVYKRGDLFLDDQVEALIGDLIEAQPEGRRELIDSDQLRAIFYARRSS